MNHVMLYFPIDNASEMNMFLLSAPRVTKKLVK